MHRTWILGSGAIALFTCAVVSCSDDNGGGSPADAGLDSARDAADAGGPAYALFVGTDFTKAELSVVSLSPDAIAGRLPVDDQDSIASASGGFGFVLERGLGKAIALDPARPWTARATIDVNDAPDAGPYASSPRTVVATTGTKAYVARYASNTVKIIDVVSGAATGSVNLAPFLAPGDPDGLVDVQDAIYDPTTQRAYFLLERIDQFDFGPAPDFVGACLGWRAQIVGVDVTNDALVDLNGAADGQAIDLLGDNPQMFVADFAAGRLVVVDAGCSVASDGGTEPARRGRGVEAVPLSAATPSWLYQSSDLDRVSALVWVDGTRAFLNKGSSWFPWNPTQTTLGPAIADFPRAPIYDGAGRIIGLSAALPDAGSDAGVVWSVVAWEIATAQLRVIAASPFERVVPATSFGVSSALLR